MSSIPTQVITDLYYRSQRNPGRWVSGGRAYEMYTFPDGRVKLTHYGTPIYRFDPKTGEYDTGGAFSASDRDAINSMAWLTGVGGASIRFGKFTPMSRNHNPAINFNRKKTTESASRLPSKLKLAKKIPLIKR